MTYREADLVNDSYKEAVQVAYIKGKDPAQLPAQGSLWVIILHKGYCFKHHWTECA